MNQRDVKLHVMEQICGAHDLSKLHLEELLDEGLKTCAEPRSKPRVSLHTQICPLVSTSAGTTVNAKSQQPQQWCGLAAMSCFSIFTAGLVPNSQLHVLFPKSSWELLSGKDRVSSFVWTSSIPASGALRLRWFSLVYSSISNRMLQLQINLYRDLP